MQALVDEAKDLGVIIGDNQVEGLNRVNDAWDKLTAAAQQVDELWFAGGFDTMIVFHEMIETPKIERQGSIGEWNIAAAPFENVPALVESVVGPFPASDGEQLLMPHWMRQRP
jgi:hypothetical protein